MLYCGFDFSLSRAMCYQLMISQGDLKTILLILSENLQEAGPSSPAALPASIPAAPPPVPSTPAKTPVTHTGLFVTHLCSCLLWPHTQGRVQYIHPFNVPLSGTTRVSRYQKGKTIWILLKQEAVSGSGISWAVCKSVPRSSQITMPAPHHLVFLQAGCPSCHPTNSVKALKTQGRVQYCSVKAYMRLVLRFPHLLPHVSSTTTCTIVTCQNSSYWHWSVCHSHFPFHLLWTTDQHTLGGQSS